MKEQGLSKGIKQDRELERQERKGSDHTEALNLAEPIISNILLYDNNIV